MKYYILILILISAYGNILAQNLVINGDFENNFGCPIVYPNTSNWSYASSSSSPDFYHVCGSIGNFNIPNNGPGYQNSNSGDAYMGMGNFESGGSREYVSTILTDTLINKQYYCFSMYVSLADSVRYASDKFGVYFSKDSVYVNTNFNLPFIPQIEFTQMISDNKNWVFLEGEYQANGGGKFITIGNFRDNSSTNIFIVNNTPSLVSYYYIDDVSLYACEGPLPEDSLYLTLPNVFTPNGDGENDNFVIEVLGVKNLKELSVKVYNRWGQKVANREFSTVSEIASSLAMTELVIWDGTTNAAAIAPKGTYFYTVTYTTTSDETFTEKSYLTLFR